MLIGWNLRFAIPLNLCYNDLMLYNLSLRGQMKTIASKEYPHDSDALANGWYNKVAAQNDRDFKILASMFPLYLKESL